ncbi:hypothetical protein MJ579_14585 [Klebsiella pneumoniae]|nr:hypothetical protein MJ579_14585 [Klebsiella pneumoniae]
MGEVSQLLFAARYISGHGRHEGRFGLAGFRQTAGQPRQNRNQDGSSSTQSATRNKFPHQVELLLSSTHSRLVVMNRAINEPSLADTAPAGYPLEKS